MTTSILNMVQTVCARNGLPVLSALQGVQDDSAVQYIGIVNKTLEDMCKRFDWQVLTQEAVFTTVSGEDQGLITTLAPHMVKILNETIYNRTLRLPLFGPMNAKLWQALKALPNSGPYYKYRIRGGRLLFNPSAASGHTCAFEYQTKLAVYDNVSDVQKETFTLDSDTILLDEDCFKAGFEWQLKAAKGLDYGEDFRRYEAFTVDMESADGTQRRVFLDRVGKAIQPGIFVPYGNWLIP